MHHLYPLAGQRCQVPAGRLGGIARQDEPFVLAEKRAHSLGQVYYLTADAGEVIGGATGIKAKLHGCPSRAIEESLEGRRKVAIPPPRTKTA
jgi:hypothetical protein